MPRRDTHPATTIAACTERMPGIEEVDAFVLVGFENEGTMRDVVVMAEKETEARGFETWVRE